MQYFGPHNYLPGLPAPSLTDDFLLKRECPIDPAIHPAVHSSEDRSSPFFCRNEGRALLHDRLQREVRLFFTLRGSSSA
jgi:hypothetical protein